MLLPYQPRKEANSCSLHASQVGTVGSIVPYSLCPWTHTMRTDLRLIDGVSNHPYHLIQTMVFYDGGGGWR